MSRCVPISGAVVVAALIGLGGCSHYLYAERKSWRHDAEVACITSGAVKKSPARVRIASISGPGACGADLPLRVSALGESGPLSYDDEPLRPPGALPDGSPPPRWPVVQSSALPPPSPPPGPPSAPTQLRWQVGAQPVAQAPAPVSPAPVSSSAPAPMPMPMPAATPAAGAPMSLYAPGVAVPDDDEAEFQPGPPSRYSLPPPPPNYSARPAPMPQVEERVPLGPQRAPLVTGAVGPVELKPAATLACPIVSALDQWIMRAVQPAALHWFRQPVVEIKQISAYSCRGMNGNPNAHISEHAFGNALDIAEFTLADGHRISVQYGWRGTPEEQGFLHDVQLAACEEFSTVLAPGANVYHYNHIHVDLMRRGSSRRICEPAAIPGEIVAERARARYAARHYGDPGITGSIKTKPPAALGYAGDEDRLPLAVPGED